VLQGRMTKRLATYREVEVELVHLPKGAVRAEVRLPSGPVTFEAPTETIAVSEAKICIDKHLHDILHRPAS